MAAPVDDSATPAAPAWIDATSPAAGRRLWGMSLVERQIRELAGLGVTRFTVWVSPTSRAAVEGLRPDFVSLFPVHVSLQDAADAGAVRREVSALGEELLLLEGDVVYDGRIFGHLVAAGPGTAVAGGGGGAALYLTGAQARSLPGWPGDPAALALLGLRVTAPEQLQHYVPSLRLTMPPFAIRVSADGDLRGIDHLMYHRTFKGVIDAVARYGYYHLVRWITRQLARTSLTPNLFTVLSVACIWAAVPCFATGRFAAGAGFAWAGVILDSVDGKLARLRVHLSEAMGAFEHVAAMPGLGLWYLATGWHLSHGSLLRGSVALTTWVLVAAFLLDKAVTGAFKACFGRELFDYRPVDAVFHLVAARRNISLVLLSAGTLVGRLEEALLAMAGWTVATLLFHLARFAWVWATARPGLSRLASGS